MEERSNSDERSSEVALEEVISSNAAREPSLKFSLKALLYKSGKLQSRNCCSNICQIITPIICLLFTIFVRIIVQGITTGAINPLNFPQPFNMPAVNTAVRTLGNLECK